MKPNKAALVVALAVATALIANSAEAGKKHPKEPKKKHFTQTGMATYYGDKFHGRKTASGERYDKDELTAAHRTLPFGAKVKVTRLDNGKSVVVKINDRGPFAKGRIIDLSRAAAEKIDMIRAGVVKVKIEVVE